MLALRFMPKSPREPANAAATYVELSNVGLWADSVTLVYLVPHHTLLTGVLMQLKRESGANFAEAQLFGGSSP
jgi:hypothetical protein